MKLILFNGSPRGDKSNTTLLLEQFIKGFGIVSPNGVLKQLYLRDRRSYPDFFEEFKQADYVIIAFPLYADAMPGIVKEFLEILPDAQGKKIGFIIQSGFPEAKHSTFVERYVKKFTGRINGEYLGTVIKGGVEGIQAQPPAFTRKLKGKFFMLGKSFAANGSFDPVIVDKLGRPYRYTPTAILIFRLLSFTGLTNLYWNAKLKENQAYDKRFDMPYMHSKAG